MSVQARSGPRRVSWSLVVASVLGLVWLYPLIWTLVNALRPTADLYRAPWDLTWPPAVGNFPTAWDRGQLGAALLSSTYVTTLTVAIVLVVSVCAAFALARLRPPARALLFLLLLAPLIVPTEVLIVPLFGMFRGLGLINSLPGLALVNAAGSTAFATVILSAYFRTIPQDVVDAAMIDGAGRLDVLVRIVVPLAMPGIIAVAAVVGLLAWNDFAGAIVLIQRPELFTVQQALTRFSTFYATDQGLSFAAMAIVLVPPLVAFVLLRSRVMQGFTLGFRSRG